MICCSMLQGIWMGMLTGTLFQMAILLFIIKTTDWEKQVHMLKFKKIGRAHV